MFSTHGAFRGVTWRSWDEQRKRMMQYMADRSLEEMTSETQTNKRKRVINMVGKGSESSDKDSNKEEETEEMDEEVLERELVNMVAWWKGKVKSLKSQQIIT